MATSPCPLLAMADLILAGYAPSWWTATRVSPPHYYHRARRCTAWLRRSGRTWTAWARRLPAIGVRMQEAA